MTKSSDDFVSIMASLTLEQRPAYYEGVKDKLPSMIQDILDFDAVISILDRLSCSYFFQPVKHKLPVLVEGARGRFRSSFDFLSPEDLLELNNILDFGHK